VEKGIIFFLSLTANKAMRACMRMGFTFLMIK